MYYRRVCDNGYSTAYSEYITIWLESPPEIHTPWWFDNNVFIYYERLSYKYNTGASVGCKGAPMSSLIIQQRIENVIEQNVTLLSNYSIRNMTNNSTMNIVNITTTTTYETK